MVRQISGVAIVPKTPILPFSVSSDVDFTGHPMDPAMSLPRGLGMEFAKSENASQSSNRDICRYLRSRPWSQQLQHLLLCSEKSLLPDNQLALILGACGPLRYVCARSSSFWQRSLKVLLERHAETFQRLDLGACNQVQSWAIHLLLKLRQRLVLFVGRTFFAHELVLGRGAEDARAIQRQEDARADERFQELEIHKGQHEDSASLEKMVASHSSIRDGNFSVCPWVCLQLTRLEISIQFKPEDGRGWDQDVFRQVGQLQRLVYLDVWKGLKQVIVPRYQNRGHRFDLPSGMAELARFRSLQYLRFDGASQQIEGEDVFWMLEHWPGLKQISYKLNNFSTATCDKLQQAMIDHACAFLTN